MLLLPSNTGAVPPAPEAAGLHALSAVPVVLPAPRRGAAGLDTGLVLGKHRLQRLNELAAEWLCLGRELGSLRMAGMAWVVWILRMISG